MSEEPQRDQCGGISQTVVDCKEESAEAAAIRTVDIKSVSDDDKRVIGTLTDREGDTGAEPDLDASQTHTSVQHSKIDQMSHDTDALEGTGAETIQQSHTKCMGEATKEDESVKNPSNDQSNQESPAGSAAEATPNVVEQVDVAKNESEQLIESSVTQEVVCSNEFQSSTVLSSEMNLKKEEMLSETLSSSPKDVVSFEVKGDGSSCVVSDDKEEVKSVETVADSQSSIGGVSVSSGLTEFTAEAVNSNALNDEALGENELENLDKLGNKASSASSTGDKQTVVEEEGVKGQVVQALGTQSQVSPSQGVQALSELAHGVQDGCAHVEVLESKQCVSDSNSASEKLGQASTSCLSEASESAKDLSAEVEQISNSKLSGEVEKTSAETSSDTVGGGAQSNVVAAAATVSGSAKTTDDEDCQTVYHIKWIGFKNEQVPIITQNDNGCCPLLAIINTLLLRGKIKLPPSSELITSNDLMAHLAECMFDLVPKNITPDSRLNYEQNMHDAIAVFPQLQTGLDVNVRFTGVSEFEYTRECIVFDLLNIPLYHGWLVDPQLLSTADAVGNCSYNQLVEKIIVQKIATDDNLATEALLAEEFLNTTASQLTYHGLSELSTTLLEDQMCVLFRNNHFSTLYKHKDELFVLVTDQGLLRESSIVWETLDNVEGDGHFVDSEFRTYRSSAAVAAVAAGSKSASVPAPDTTWAAEQPSITPANISDPQSPATGTSKEQIDHDYLVALSLVQDYDEGSSTTEASSWPDAAAMQLSDHELAQRLQEEENRSAAAAAGTASGGAGGKEAQGEKPQSSSTASGGSSGSGRDRSREKDKEKDKSSCLVM